MHGGFGAEIAAEVEAAAFDQLDSPIERVGAPFAPVPFRPPLEDDYLPGRKDVTAAVRALLGDGGSVLSPHSDRVWVAST